MTIRVLMRRQLPFRKSVPERGAVRFRMTGKGGGEEFGDQEEKEKMGRGRNHNELLGV